MQRRPANEVALTVAKGTEEWLKAQRTRPGGGSHGAAQSRPEATVLPRAEG